MTFLKRLSLLFSRFSPVEKTLLEAVEKALPGEEARLFRSQLGAVNQVQRILDWTEIDFYCLRFMRVIAWNPTVLFPNRSEFILARIAFTADGKELESAVWAVSGHLFSIETEGGLKKYAFSERKVMSVTVSKEIMAKKELGPSTRATYEDH